MIEYREYRATDETGWLRCRVLSFLDSPFYDDVAIQKPGYDGDCLQLVAVDRGRIVGFLDIQFEEETGSHCYGDGPTGAVIWELGVHPDCRRQGIATNLLGIAKAACIARDRIRLQAWTREDKRACGWYEALGFRCVYAYYHVWFVGQKLRDAIGSPFCGLALIRAYGEYTGDEPEVVASSADRMVRCICYELDTSQHHRHRD